MLRRSSMVYDSVEFALDAIYGGVFCLVQFLQEGLCLYERSYAARSCSSNVSGLVGSFFPYRLFRELCQFVFGFLVLSVIFCGGTLRLKSD